MYTNSAGPHHHSVLYILSVIKVYQSTIIKQTSTSKFKNLHISFMHVFPSEVPTNFQTPKTQGFNPQIPPPMFRKTPCLGIALGMDKAMPRYSQNGSFSQGLGVSFTTSLKSPPRYQELNLSKGMIFFWSWYDVNVHWSLENSLRITSLLFWVRKTGCNYLYELMMWVCLKKSKLTGNCSTPSQLLKHQPFRCFILATKKKIKNHWPFWGH